LVRPWTPAERCRNMVRHARPDSAPIAMTVYPGAHHAFDVVQLQPGRQVYGHWIESMTQLPRMRKCGCAPFSPRIWSRRQRKSLPRSEDGARLRQTSDFGTTLPQASIQANFRFPTHAHLPCVEIEGRFRGKSGRSPAVSAKARLVE